MASGKLFALAIVGSALLVACGKDSKKVESLSNEPLVAVSGGQLEQALKNGLRRALENNHKDVDGDGVYYPYELLWVGSNATEPAPPVRAKWSIDDGNTWFIAIDKQDDFYNQNPTNGFAAVSLGSNSGSAEHIGMYKEPENAENLVFTQKLSDASELGFQSSQTLPGRLQVQATDPGPAPLYPSILTLPNQIKLLQGQESDFTYNAARDDSLVNLGGLFHFGDSGKTPYVATIAQVTTNDTRVQSVDVSQPDSPQLSWSVTIEGKVRDAQQLGDTLILITERSVIEDGLHPVTDELSESQKQQITEINNQRLSVLKLEDLITQYSVDGNTEALTQSCFVQRGFDFDLGVQRLINVTTINVQERSIDSVCVSGRYETVGMNRDSLFLAGAFRGSSDAADTEATSKNTVIHAFDIRSGDTKYTATTSVSGSLQPPGPSLFDYIFAAHIPESVSYAYKPFDISGSELRLHVMDGEENKLHRLYYDNGAFSPLGIEGGVLLSGDSGHARTLEFTDESVYALMIDEDRQRRLKVVNLQSGETEFVTDDEFLASYSKKHIINDRYMFFVENVGGRQEPTVEVASFAFLYDLSTTPPTQLSKITLAENATSTIPKQIVLQQVEDDAIRFAYHSAVEHEPEEGSELSDGPWENGVQMFEVTGLKSANARLNNLAFMVLQSSEGGDRRGSLEVSLKGDELIVRDSIAVWFGTWSGVVNSPEPVVPAECTVRQGNNIRVQLNKVEDFGPNNLCSSSVTLTQDYSDHHEQLVPASEPSESVCVFEGAPDRFGSFRVEASTPGIDESFTALYVPGPNYCASEPELVVIDIAPKTYCQTLTAPAFLIAVKTEDGDQSAACNSSLEVKFKNLTWRQPIKPTPKSELAADLAAKLDDSVSCVYLGPTLVSPQSFFDFKLEAEGYAPLEASSQTTQRVHNVCAPELKVFEATLLKPSSDLSSNLRGSLM